MPERFRSRFFGCVAAAFNVGTISAYAASPALIERFDWPGTFAIYGAVGVGLAALWAVVGRDAPGQSKTFTFS